MTNLPNHKQVKNMTLKKDVLNAFKHYQIKPFESDLIGFENCNLIENWSASWRIEN